MRILLTNGSLESRSGSELYLAEIAIWLRRQGHVPIVYSARQGVLASTIRRHAIPVIDDLASLAEPPDLIHAQHHLSAMAALARFPDTPAVYVCHGWLPWEESPPRHPAIRRYVAVSQATRERLVSESGVPSTQVRILPNFVDLQRFRLRDMLPSTPARALVFSNQTNGHDWVNVVRAACAVRGIALDVAGLGCGCPLESPEAHLPGYDLVFARGRSAIEAMAAGVAVILCDVEGLGPLVTPGNLDYVRDGNFGMQVLSKPHRAELLLREIDRYDAGVARQTSRMVRDGHDLERVAGMLTTVYGEAIADVTGAAHTADDARAAQAAYLQWVNRSFPRPWSEQREGVGRQLHLAGIATKAAIAERDSLAIERDDLRSAQERLIARMASASEQHDAVKAEADSLRRELGHIRSGFLFRRLLPLIWNARLRLIPDGSARFRWLAWLRYRVGCLLAHQPRTTPPAAAAAMYVPEEARLSCVVLDVGGQPSLADAVRSLAAQQPAPEIVVVSSGGGDARRVIAATGVDATVIASRQRLLPGAARNVGVAATREPYVAFLAGDCVAEPGWVAGRLAAHAAGADVVSSAVTNAARWNPFAIAAHHLLFASRLPGTPAHLRLDYGASYARSLFTRYGGFRSDLRIGEDTEFHQRFQADVPMTFRGDVRSAHRNPATLAALVRDQYHRGVRAVRARTTLYGGSARRQVAINALTRVPRSLWIGVRATSMRGWPSIAWGVPWMPIGAAAYALGATSSSGAESPIAVPTPARPNRLLCVIAFRNERRYLPGFLANVAPHVDGILALDDGSSDGSADIVAAHPSVREVLRVEPREPHVWDERRNRRVLIDAAGRHGAEWIVALDADERVERHFRARANVEMDRAVRDGSMAYKLIFREMWDAPDRYRVDGVWGLKQSVRLFRFRRDHDFGVRALHGHWAPENSRLPNGDWAAGDLIVYHLRMVAAEDRERRKLRYLTLDPERRWQAIGYEYLTDERDLKIETFPPGRDYTPLAVEESVRVDAFREELEAVAVRGL